MQEHILLNLGLPFLITPLYNAKATLRYRFNVIKKYYKKGQLMPTALIAWCYPLLRP